VTEDKVGLDDAIAGAMNADLHTGRFYTKGRQIDAPPYTRDPEVARRLWEACATLTR
jgi:hypothetical protein